MVTCGVSTGGDFIQIVDAAMAEAVRKSGDWLVCKPGCCDCCVGPFPISPQDGQRLREGLAELETADPERAARVRQRVSTATNGDDEACPVLDPEAGTCDLYAWRPVTCRVFGPPVLWGGDAVGVCELCFDGASDEEIAACAVEIVGQEEGQEEGEQMLVSEALAVTTT